MNVLAVLLFVSILFFPSTVLAEDALDNSSLDNASLDNVSLDNVSVDNVSVSETSLAEQKSSTLPTKEKKNYAFLSNQKLAVVTKKEPASTMDALSVSLGLIFILVLIFSLAWFMKKMGYNNSTDQGQLKIIAALNLGQKEKIAVIQVGHKQLLIGMTATQINTLHVLDEFLDASEGQLQQSGQPKFADKLTELLQKKGTSNGQ